MGGASRNEDKRRREASAARMRAAGITPAAPPAAATRSPLIYVAAVLGVAVLVGLGVFLYSRSGGTVVPTYTVAAAKGVITLGNTSAPVKVDIYEDYLCPGCQAFTNRDHDELTTALNEGKITVKFHPIAILNEKTTPAGYSTRAANAALCAVDAGILPAYHDKLFAEQPNEGGPGLPDSQLIAFGTELGAGAGFGQCVTTGPNAKAIDAETKRAAGDSALQTNGGFGTPTVAVAGKKVSISSSGWLADAIAAG